MITIKSALGMLCVALVMTAHGQAFHTEDSTALRVTGLVRHGLVLRSGEPSAFTIHKLEDVRIISSGHKLKKQFSATGILLKDVLDSAGILAPGHKLKRSLRVVLVARDGYEAVFSEQELFNTPVGGEVYLLYGARPAAAKSDGPWMSVSLKDRVTGPRYVKWLSRIVVKSE